MSSWQYAAMRRLRAAASLVRQGWLHLLIVLQLVVIASLSGWLIAGLALKTTDPSRTSSSAGVSEPQPQ